MKNLKSLEKVTTNGFSPRHTSSQKQTLLPLPTFHFTKLWNKAIPWDINFHGFLQEPLVTKFESQPFGCNPYLLLMTVPHKEFCSKSNLQIHLPNKARFFFFKFPIPSPPLELLFTTKSQATKLSTLQGYNRQNWCYGRLRWLNKIQII